MEAWKGPAKLDSRCDDAASNFAAHAGKLNREVRIEQSDFFNAIPRHQVGQLTDHAFRREGIEAPLVKHHVGAVIAGIRTADAGGVANLSALR